MDVQSKIHVQQCTGEGIRIGHDSRVARTTKCVESTFRPTYKHILIFCGKTRLSRLPRSDNEKAPHRLVLMKKNLEVQRKNYAKNTSEQK